MSTEENPQILAKSFARIQRDAAKRGDLFWDLTNGNDSDYLQ